jgi:DNA-binding NarL/FixJ family response regulator
LVDDHALVRKGLANLLRAEPDFEVVGEAGDGVDAIAKAPDFRPDIILMDVRMPRMNGLDATPRILATLPAVKMVMLTVTEDEDAVFDAVKRGAQGYRLKSIEPQTLFDLLRGVLRGEAALSSGQATQILLEFARQSRRPAETVSPLAQLSGREQDVLALIADGRSNKEIATVLDLGDNTVKNYVKNILEKLHLENRVQAAVFAFEEDRASTSNGKPPQTRRLLPLPPRAAVDGGVCTRSAHGPDRSEQEPYSCVPTPRG